MQHTAYLGDLDQVPDQVRIQPKCPVKPTGNAQTRQLPKSSSQARAHICLIFYTNCMVQLVYKGFGVVQGWFTVGLGWSKKRLATGPTRLACEVRRCVDRTEPRAVACRRNRRSDSGAAHSDATWWRPRAAHRAGVDDCLAAMGARYGLAGRYDEPARLRADCPTSMYFARPIARARGRPP